MGKRFGDPTDRGDTRLLYKKSISTIQTRSRTNSGLSQIYTKNGVLHLKKKQSQSITFSIGGNKGKRDLSMETDLCVLRRYCRNKRNKHSCHGDIKKTAITRDSKQKPEAGDTANILKNVDVVSLIVENFKTLINKWIKEQILENDNMQKIDTVRDTLLHRLDLKSQRDSMSQSTFVYNVTNSMPHIKCPRRKRNGKRTFKGKDKPKAVVKCSCYTIPFQYKKFRIVSTLSMPRNFDKSTLMSEDSSGRCLYRLKKISRKNIFLSLEKPKEMFVDSSTFNLLAMSSRSLTKRCATYTTKGKKEEMLRRKIVFQSKPIYKSATESMSSISIDSVKHPKQKLHPEIAFENLPSLIKRIYGDIPSGTNPSYVFIKNDNCTMTDTSPSPGFHEPGLENSESKGQIQGPYSKTNLNNPDILSEKDLSDPMLTIDFISHSLEFPQLAKTETAIALKNMPHKRSYPKNNRISKKRAHTRLRKLKTANIANICSNIDNIKYKHFTYLYKKVNRKRSEYNEFVGHFENILQHFAGYDGQKNIRLDVHVNVYPITENVTPIQDNEMNICANLNNSVAVLDTNIRSLDTLIEFQENETSSLKQSKIFKSDDSPEIVSLLDGAISQAKYMIVSENDCAPSNGGGNGNKEKRIVNVLDSTTITSDLEISNEIVELKNVIKDLAITAEKLMYEHLKEKYKATPKQTTILYNPTSPVVTSTEGSQAPLKKREINKNKSKGIQISTNFIKNNTGIKVKKEPKRPDATELYTKLMEKSTTYRFIESESILKVTDMTSQGNNKSEKDKGPIDVGITCSIPKSDSISDEADKEKHGLMAFFCDGIYRQPCRPHESTAVRSMYLPHGSASKQCCRSIVNERTQPYNSCPTCHQPPKLITEPPRNCPEEGLTHWSLDTDSKSEEDTKVIKQSTNAKNRVLYKSLLYSTIILIPIFVVVLMYYFLIIKNTFITKELKAVPEKKCPRKTVQHFDMQCTEENCEHQANARLSKQIQPANHGIPCNFVVGFAFQETYDDLTTARQMICYKKRSPAASEYSITPKNSTRTLSADDNDLQNALVEIPDASIINIGSDRDEGGDMDKVVPEIITNFVIVKNIEDDSTQPQVVCKIANHNKTTKRPKKQVNKYRCPSKIKSSHKHNRDGQCTRKKLGQLFAKALSGDDVSNLSNAIDSNSFSKIISGSRVLRKVLAKESLIKNSDLKENSNENSQSASFITATDSFVSFASQNTLTYDGSSTSSKADGLSLSDSVDSVVHLTPGKPFKTGIINISRAVVNNKTFGAEVTKPSSDRRIAIEEELTSTEAISVNLAVLTSEPLSEVLCKANSDNHLRPEDSTSETSIDTLTEAEKASTTEASDSEDAFFNAKTSSYFKSNYNTNPELILQIPHPDVSIKANLATTDIYSMKPTIMDTVLNIGLFPEITSEVADYRNDVVITEKGNNRPFTDTGDERNVTKVFQERVNVITKRLDAEPNMTYVKPKTDINLPNEETIKEILQGKPKNENITCAEELRNVYPTNLSELWDKLLEALDATAKKIEESISDKIIKELQRSLSVLDKLVSQADLEAGAASNTINLISNKAVNPKTVLSALDEGLQCCLVQNETIDELMRQSLHKPIKIATPTTCKDSVLIEDEFEILKPPCVKEVAERGDTIKITPATTSPFIKTLKTLSSMTRLSVVWYFLKENVFVVTGVPIFMVTLILVYLVIIIIVKLV